MQRGKPLRRKTPLTSTTPLARGTTPLRRTPLPRTAPKPGVAGPARKPTAVSPEERRARKLVRARSGGICEGCAQAEATNYSHRIGRGVGGVWCPSNGLDMCGSGSTGCHGLIGDEPTRARDELGWRLRSTDDPLSFPVLLAVHGWSLLDVDGGFRPAAPPADLAA